MFFSLLTYIVPGLLIAQCVLTAAQYPPAEAEPAPIALHSLSQTHISLRPVGLGLGLGSVSSPFSPSIAAVCQATMTPSPSHIVVREHPDHLHFALQARSASYHFHVDRDSGDLVHDHFGASVPGFTPPKESIPQGWGGVLTEARREFPDHGRGDFRLPAIRVRGEGGRGHAISRLAYDCYEITHGKASLNGLPATFGGEEDVETLSIHLKDKHAGLSVKLNYSVFPKYNAIARSFSLTNQGSQEVVLERAASFSVDMANEEADWDMVQLSGDWTKENRKERRKIQFGTQG
jgi:hypothetical protein